MSIFREYDIRGVVGQDLTLDLTEQIGKAFGTYLLRHGSSHTMPAGRQVSLGWDVRLSSPSLRERLIAGILSTGLDITDIGVCPTPLLYFSLFRLPVQGGVMITGSHNSAEFNGFKLCVGKSTLYGEEIQKIRQLIERKDYEEGRGTLKTSEIIPNYIDYLTDQFSKSLKSRKRRLKVVADAGNGTAGAVAPRLLKNLGCEVVELYCEGDGRFPNHHPDPTVTENLKDLVSKVKETRADLGIGYDGDADRIGVVDEKGQILWGDRLMLIFARAILGDHKANLPPPVFISEVKGSHLLYEDIRKRGGKAIMWKTGHSLIKAKMKEEGAVLAGEMSGHMFFSDRYFGYDDAIYASCRLVEILTHSQRSLSDLLSDLPRTYSTPEIRVDCPDSVKFKVVESLKTKFQDPSLSRPPFPIQEVNTVDGIRITFSNGWGLVRASNTQPALVLRYEADSQDGLSKIKDFIETLTHQTIRQTKPS
jgi:phosphomannomutase/phosphoglucomutase